MRSQDGREQEEAGRVAQPAGKGRRCATLGDVVLFKQKA
jgi:hypothetical protein